VDPDSEQLYSCASQGDTRSFEQLLERYLPKLRAFVRVRLDAGFRSRESSSDLVQSVCRELVEHAELFHYRGESQFRGWLFTAALNKIREKHRFHRRARRDVRRELHGTGESSDDGLFRSYADLSTPSRGLEQREWTARFEAAYDELPEDHREVISLARIARLPHGEVAACMGRSVGAVRQLLARALNRLAAELETREAQ